MDRNHRIMIVDDQEDLRMQVAKMLQQRSADLETASLIAQIRHRIGRGRESAPQNQRASYEVDTFAQGKDAYEGVKKAIAENRPYALMFLDMRMPPGWDGMETAQRIRTIDREMQIVIMTAYADYDQSEMADKIGEPDKLLYIKKPFHPEEIRQLALALTEKWNLNRREKERLVLTNRLMRENGYLTRQGFESLQTTNNSILNAFVSFVDAREGALIQRNAGDLLALASTSEAAATAILDDLSDEEKNSPRMIANDKAGSILLPIIFGGFDGFVYMRGKGLNFPFDQLRPFLDILMETARGVLRNGIFMAEQQPADELSVVAPALGNLAAHCIGALEESHRIAKQVSEATDITSCSELGLSLQRQIAPLIATNQRLKTLARVAASPLNLATHDVGALLERAVSPHRESARAAEIDISMQIEPGVSITADSELMQVALTEVIGTLLNSLKEGTSSNGKKVVIKSAQREDDDIVRVEISENARGMSEMKEGKLFEPFQGGEDGLNIGMTISRHVILRHRGTIRCDNVPGHGCTFHINLPISGP